MSLLITPVHAKTDVQRLAGLASEIWWQHFPPIIGKAQVEYMVKKFQSETAILEQLEQGYDYFLAEIDGLAVGYTGLLPDAEAKKLMISKLYVKENARDNGVGQTLLDFIEKKCNTEGLDTLWLTVNRGNTGPINWYLKRGFRITKEVDMDIGEGFIMDDYIMEKDLHRD
ncbi:MAG: GNAT family N-acetyltransferase [Candidatus Marinimicrobia bacterium]|nr:GNAT family N-acetyltransferase [Candidatus Neomarinimicrobiota bacterium]MCF7850277.1 GNAT family N-acetyltransferase [Candidatus Neomarinimicrobiota bacterium]MCF7903826.1 GNAT family N-acetyltransferase [Candidatus Neomarinimicrobiota bacterium]